MSKQNKLPISLVLSVIALLLAGYASYGVVQLREKHKEDVFKASIFDAIDDYVAEKTGQPTGPVDVSIDDDPVKGDEKAPVTMVEFTDYQCPFCGRYSRETLPQIVENYINTGKVKYVLRDFPLGNHPDAGPAGNAAECIREQGGDDMYYDYHDILFNNQSELSKEKLKEYAADFSIDQNEFASCMDSNKYAEEMKADFDDGNSYGVRGTPAFFINGNLIAGAQPYENFEAAIEQALAEAK
ncbi:DsbA family protein [Candidatus Peregrinibacteria bacterium]|nr:DsbA family protein [Candidatus Peregrinibacteria bacterium]